MRITPTATEMEVESPAPATPMGRPVGHPAIMMGERMALRTTVMTCTRMVGFTIPVPRRAAPMEMRANWSPSPGRNHMRYVVPAAMVSASAPTRRMYAPARV